jgi:hypothetical protein
MKGNRFFDTIKEYSRKLSDDDLYFIATRLAQRVGSDVGDVIEFMQRNQDVDYCLSGSKDANDFFDMIDAIDNIIQNEFKRREKK